MTATEKKNAAFGQLGRAEKKVQIMKDILSLLRRRVFKAPGFTAYVRTDWTTFGVIDPSATDLQQVLPKAECKVCALGAAFCALVIRDNHSPIELHRNAYRIERSDVVARLRSVFTDAEMNAIEAAYEGEERVDCKAPRVCWDFAKSFVVGEPRLIAICKNIILNNGTFKPAQDVKPRKAVA